MFGQGVVKPRSDFGHHLLVILSHWLMPKSDLQSDVGCAMGTLLPELYDWILHHKCSWRHSKTFQWTSSEGNRPLQSQPQFWMAWLFWLVTSSQSPNLCIVTWCAVNIGNGTDYISHPRAANLNIKLCSSKEPCPEDYDNYSAPFILEYKVQNKPTAFLATDTTCQIRMAQGRTMPEHWSSSLD